MPRPPRIQVAGGIYHVTSRGNRRQEIFADDRDRRTFLQLLRTVSARHSWHCHAFCLMPNHYHLLVTIPAPNLSCGIQQLNGVYAQAFNERHELTGHLFQGRFHSAAVESESHLLEIARYLALNPVRSGLCQAPGEWQWSSYLATVGVKRSPEFLQPDWLLSLFGRSRPQALASFRRFVDEGVAPALGDVSGVRPRTWLVQPSP